MCHEYKLACRNRCWQLLNSLPCFGGELYLVHWWQTVEVLPMQPRKTPKVITCTTCGGSSTFTPFSKTVHQHTPLRDGYVFGSRDAWFHAPCCLVLLQWTSSISKPDKVHHRSSVADVSSSWNKWACTQDTLWHQCYIMTSKEYLTNSHILLKYFK